ncbi:MAG: DEAD/DEAH box helicase [Candidatus Mcinerneyibacterium aminivorans]|uniref:DEAD/DEAH box helicase n=1 Tax=Candidatus Mcinerneyibacterium aminivorans TaxID=2703815 RepID=A0A5D0MJP6_9BACT|nr:MAG: DEAD/DEAH box helicase [Candidatus Mcinerneyibacterium aminivorans]
MNNFFKNKNKRALLEDIRKESFYKNFKRMEEIEKKEANFKPIPEFLDNKLINYLKSKGIDSLYSHQYDAINKINNDENVVVVTPTASGKTMCYNLPVFNELLKEKGSRALYLFPTKALSQDQLSEIQDINDSLEEVIKCYTFDGDTPSQVRKIVKEAGDIVVTNPDMLHQGILPNHTKWVNLFESLKYVVIDEMHQYKGVFGSHVANVLRRLKRITEFYGTDIQFIFTSATIANPVELAEKLTGEDVSLVRENGAPSRKKYFMVYDPPVIDENIGIRRSSLKEAVRIAKFLLKYDLKGIVFLRSRIKVELFLSYMRKYAKKLRIPLKKIASYRGGYLPGERRKIERKLKNDEISLIASTNALELGIDIGSLNFSITVGYPGSISSVWQQAGRAGRQDNEAFSLFVCTAAPIDQYIAKNPKFLFEETVEKGIIDPNNHYILTSHLKCAAFELNFKGDETFGLPETQEILKFMEEENVVKYKNGKWYWTDDVYPAQDISLRSAAMDNFVIVDKTDDKHQVIGEVDFFSASTTIYEKAIYLHRGTQYEVQKLDWENRKAYVKEVQVNYYTDAETKVDIKILDKIDSRKDFIEYGEINATTIPTIYKKIKFFTHENLGWGEIKLPEIEMNTTSVWFNIDEKLIDEMKISKNVFGMVLGGLAYLLRNLIPLYVMCDVNDIKVISKIKDPNFDAPTLYIYDNYPGGIGLSEKMLEDYSTVLNDAYDYIKQCECKEGCPSCIGPVEVSANSVSASNINLKKKVKNVLEYLIFKALV